MFMSTLSLIAPSLWFISSLGLAQLQVAQEPVNQRNKIEQPAGKSVKKAPRKKSEKKTRDKPTGNSEIPRTTKTTPPDSQDKVTTTNCENAEGKITDPICVVKRLQDLYQTAESITAHFTQEYTYAVYKRTQKSSGRLFLKKPGRMRWDYRKPETKVFVSNGDVLWVYEPNKNQAHRKSLRESEIPIAISFLMGEGNLLDEFTPHLVSVSALIKLKLTPKQPSRHYKQLELQIDPATYMVVQTTIVDPANNRNTVRFSNLKLNQHLPLSGFEFIPPEGVKIL